MQATSRQSSRSGIVITENGEEVALEGVLNARTLAQVKNRFAQRKPRAVDVAKLAVLDTIGALFLCELDAQDVKLTGIPAEHRPLLELVRTLELEPLTKPAPIPRWRELVIDLGRGAHAARNETVEVITFIGRAVSAIGRALMHPRDLRVAA